MVIRLDQITDEPFRWQETLSVPVESLERSQLLELGEVEWAGEVGRTTSGFLLTANVSYGQVLECPRCLGRSEADVRSEFELAIQPKSQEPVVGELELEEADLGLLYIDSETLDTKPLLIEQIQLNIPMRQLCREDCAGLCPQCGIDRNQESCNCEEHIVDPKWSALAGLRDRLDN